MINFLNKNQNEEKELLSQFIQKERELGKEVLIDENAYRFVNEYFEEKISSPILHFKGTQSIVQFFNSQFLTTSNLKIQFLIGEHESIFDYPENLELIKNEFHKILKSIT